MTTSAPAGSASAGRAPAGLVSAGPVPADQGSAGQGPGGEGRASQTLGGPVPGGPAADSSATTGPAATGPLRVLVVDDQDLIRGGFAMILDAQPDIRVVGEAADGAEAIRAAVEYAPDVVLMDVRMPRVNGMTATAEICRRTTARVLVLTMFDLDEYVYEALRAGASGFLLKDVRRDDLVRAVRQVAAGESLLAPSVLKRLIVEMIGRGEARPVLASRLRELTDRETDTLRQLAAGRSNSEIAAALVLSEHTVKSHVSSMLTKLGLRDRSQAVMFAYESGLIVAGRTAES